MSAKYWEMRCEEALSEIATLRSRNETLVEKVRGLNIALDSLGHAIHDATGTPPINGELALERLAIMGERRKAAFDSGAFHE